MEEHSPIQPAATGYLALVRTNHNFRNLWLGQIISLLGDWFNLIASATLVSSLTGSGVAISALFIIRMLAQFVISPFAGAWADRYDRRKLLILTDLFRAAIVLGFLLVRDGSQVWLLYTLTALQLAVSGVFFPTRNAILPDVVSPQELGAANALSSATWSVMLALGSALGGLSTGLIGVYPSFIVDSVSFLISAFFISRVVYRRDAAGGQQGTSLIATLRQYADGLRYLRTNPDIMAIALLKTFSALTLSGAFQVLQVDIAQKIYPIGEGGGISLGLMYAFVGMGTGFGPILARIFTGDRHRPMRTAILMGYVVGGFGLATVGLLASFPVTLVGTLMRGLGAGIVWVFSTQLLLQLVPNRVRGRVFSTEFALLTLAQAAAAATGGWALDSSGLELTQILYLAAGTTVVPAVLWGLWLLFGKRAEGLREAAEAG